MPTKGIATGGKGEISPPPRDGKHCCRKMMLFSKALFLVTNFPKIILKFNFSFGFLSKTFQVFLIFPKICVSRPNPRKISAFFLQSFEKYDKIMRF